MPQTKQLTYTKLSPSGMAKAFSNFSGVPWQGGLLSIDNDVVALEMNRVLIPGDIELIFLEYEYKEDIIYQHEIEQEQNFILWIDCVHTNYQELTLINEAIEDSATEQNNAYLINTLFPYRQLRTKGSKGKALLIFLPNIYLENFLTVGETESVLGRFYAIQQKGKSIIKLQLKQLKIMEELFLNWKENKNVVALTKNTFQLIEWYFAKLVSDFDFSRENYKLNAADAIDLFLLQNFMGESVSKLNLDINSDELKVKTPILKLKQLYEIIHGKSIYDGFKEVKLTQAKKMLLESDKNIAEIAYEFGYSNPSNFSSAFKKQFGIMPNECRINNNDNS